MYCNGRFFFVVYLFFFLFLFVRYVCVRVHVCVFGVLESVCAVETQSHRTQGLYCDDLDFFNDCTHVGWGFFYLNVPGIIMRLTFYFVQV